MLIRKMVKSDKNSFLTLKNLKNLKNYFSSTLGNQRRISLTEIYFLGPIITVMTSLKCSNMLHLA